MTFQVADMPAIELLPADTLTAALIAPPKTRVYMVMSKLSSAICQKEASVPEISISCSCRVHLIGSTEPTRNGEFNMLLTTFAHSLLRIAKS